MVQANPAPAPTPQAAPQPQPAAAATLPTRKRGRPGERVDGWVEGVLMGMQRPPKSNGRIDVGAPVAPYFLNGQPIYPGYTPVINAPDPATVNFRFYIMNYPSGPVTSEEIATWADADFDILWSSGPLVDYHYAPGGAVTETPALRAEVDGFLRAYQAAGWQYVGLGTQWFNHVLRAPYNVVNACLATPLKWK
jgi:hypothetical protein